ncbi:MAG TPA: NTP transferase domain-containing protein [Candidatus Baltobacteraceae bacterium]|nr:NTP transferase domain-containing protein [Candidatus Baltobacteraceae bacterium]
MPDEVTFRTVVLGGGRSSRMGFDKLTAPFAGEPLLRRLVLALEPLVPLVVTTAAGAAVLEGLPFATVVVTEPTAGPAASLALADAAVPPEVPLAVLPGDLPFLDAARVEAFVRGVPPETDVAWPVVGGTPGHPVVWSPRARGLLTTLMPDEPPSRLRRDARLVVAPIQADDDAYVTDVDTPDAWEAALARVRP